MRSSFWLLVLLLATSVYLAPSPVGAADEQCFPETGQCISGRFRSYWEENGGLSVFGYPLTPARTQADPATGQSYLTQWFERGRFELHTENAPPYDVLLGLLGNDGLRRRGIDWHTLPPATGPRSGCRWFEETKHNVCDQAPGVGFLSYWQKHGLLDPKLDAYGRSLMLFGLPLTEATVETNPADGKPYLTQWFERARFEWHPDEPDAYKVLLGLLGREENISVRKVIANVEEAFIPSGWMGDLDDIALNPAWTDNPLSAPTSIRITYSAAKSRGQGWAGVYWQYPENNWGNKPEGRDLSGATRLTFWARGERGGEQIEFKVGGIQGQYPDSIRQPISTGVLVLTQQWQQYTINLTGQDLRHVVGGFVWATSAEQNPGGATFFLDDIWYE